MQNAPGVASLLCRRKMTKEEKKKLEIIVGALQKAGFDPVNQLQGYMITGRDYYITRTDNARELIKTVSRDSLGELLSFIEKND